MTHLDTTIGLLGYLRDLPDDVVPSEKRLHELVDRCLVLTNPEYPRESVVRKLTSTIVKWLKKYGKVNTINLVEAYLIDKRHIVIRRLDNGNDNADRDGGSKDQPIDVSADTRVAGRTEEIPRPEVGDSGPQRLRIIEGGGDKRNGQGSQAVEPVEGGAYESDAREEGISKRLVELELREHQEDLRVFQKAYSGIRARVRTVEDEGRFMKLATWSGTTATLGVLELVIHNLEHVVAELKDIITKIDSGSIHNLDKE